MILRRKIDVHVDHVVRQMLGQGILRLLLIAAFVAKRFEVLEGADDKQ